MDPNPNSNISVLTEDLLTQILNKLAHDPDRKSFRAVSTDFNRVESTTRTRIRILRPEFLPGLLSKYGSIRVLDLSVCPRMDDVMVKIILAGSTQWTRSVKSLILCRAVGLRSGGLGMLVRSCPGLEMVDVSHCCGFGDREAAALTCAGGLRIVKMDKCLGVSDVGLANLAVGCGKLEELSLKWCLEISDLGIDFLAKKCLDLKSLDISYLKVTNKSLESIATMQKLEVLTMVGCSLVDDVGLRCIAKGCPSLQVLNASRCDRVGSSGISSVIKGHCALLQLSMGYSLPELSESFVHSMKDMKNLTSIIVDGVRVSDYSLEVIGTSCKHLLEIGLSKCIGVADRGITKLASGCVNLRNIYLTCCHSITDVAIAAIADRCRDLRCLKLESCNLITEESLDLLGFYCLLLQELDLTDCSGLNDTGLNYLSRCSELAYLKLGLCINISDKGLFYIASNCSNIRELDLYRCTNIGNDGLAALSSGCKKLEKLNLSYCTGIGDRGMEHLNRLIELSDLELRGLANITSIGLAAVASGCKRLADLDLKHCENINDSGFRALAYYSRNLRQINMSHCTVSDTVLCMVMGNLTRLQDAKLVHLAGVSPEGFELALRASCAHLKKIKLHSSLRFSLSQQILHTLHVRGCRVRWD